MKKILITAILLLSVPGFVWAQKKGATQKCSSKEKTQQRSVLRQGEGEKLIPISREQAEILVTELVTAALERDSIEAQRELDDLVMRTKVEALKRKMIDEALAKSYSGHLEARLDRLERLLLLMLANNSKLPPQVLQTLILPESGSAPAVLPSSSPIIVNTPPPAPRPAIEAPRFREEKAATPAPIQEQKPAKVELMIDAKNLPKDTIVEYIEVAQARMPRISHRVFFAVGSDKVSEESKTALDQVVVYLETYPNQRIRLNGYASPEGNLAKNNALSAKRVEAVKRYLMEKGIDGSRIETRTGGIDSVSATPAQARRVDIVSIDND
ncbi:MAG: OmpA family protein [Porphyromonas sp.]|nr:OmpA family protein [Porphyromonas sp.]